MNKKAINILLITIGFVLWIMVFYRIVWRDGADQKAINVPKEKKWTPPAKDTLQSLYDEHKMRDPFQTPFNMVRKKSPPKVQKKLQPKKREQPPPQLKLLGMVSDAKGALAMVRFPDGNIRFVRKGQVIDGITIRGLGGKKLTFVFNKKEYEIQM